MVDHTAVSSVTIDCERYWRAAGIGKRAAADMRRELEAHLVDASLDGRSVESVVGSDIGAFAADWAAAQRPDGDLPTWNEVFSTRRRRSSALVTAILVVGTAAVIIAAVLAGNGSEESMDNEVWRWIWVGMALFLGFAEIVTAGLFMLPFAAGAVIAGALAWAGVAPVVALVVFIVSSVVFLILLQIWGRREAESPQQIGANRIVGSMATVMETVDRAGGTGRVRMDTEQWRATTDGSDVIEPSTEVRVVEVRGARLVVEVIEVIE